MGNGLVVNEKSTCGTQGVGKGSNVKKPNRQVKGRNVSVPLTGQIKDSSKGRPVSKKLGSQVANFRPDAVKKVKAEEVAPGGDYKIQKGDNLYTLAKIWGCTVDDILKANPQIDPKTKKINAGKILKRPNVANVKEPDKKETPNPVQEQNNVSAPVEVKVEPVAVQPQAKESKASESPKDEVTPVDLNTLEKPCRPLSEKAKALMKSFVGVLSGTQDEFKKKEEELMKPYHAREKALEASRKEMSDYYDRQIRQAERDLKWEREHLETEEGKARDKFIRNDVAGGMKMIDETAQTDLKRIERENEKFKLDSQENCKSEAVCKGEVSGMPDYQAQVDSVYRTRDDSRAKLGYRVVEHFNASQARITNGISKYEEEIKTLEAAKKAALESFDNSAKAELEAMKKGIDAALAAFKKAKTDKVNAGIKDNWSYRLGEDEKVKQKELLEKREAVQDKYKPTKL